uniref:Rpl30 n=1 Tax=Arundo donax TaxID=35708 RepID=A0A0A9FUZ1_ARUDO
MLCSPKLVCIIFMETMLILALLVASTTGCAVSVSLTQVTRTSSLPNPAPSEKRSELCQLVEI